MVCKWRWDGAAEWLVRQGLRAAAWCVALGVSAVLAQPTPAPAPAPAAGRFDILEFQVDGNSLLPQDAVELSVMPHMGEKRSLQDVENARSQLERRYHEAGFLTVLVTIPEQKVDDGLVTLLVTEAPVGRLRVVGSEYHLPSAIKQNLAEVAEGKVPNFTALQQSLAEVNRSADLKVAPVLKPGRAPGTVDVQLDVDDQLPLHGNVELANRQALNTSALRLNASVRYDNLWQKGHSVGLSLVTSPERTAETQVLSANYLWPLRGGDALSFYGLSSRSQFATLYNSPGLGLLGNSEIVGARYSMALGGQSGKGGFVQTFTLGVDRKQIEQTVSLNGLGVPSPAVTYVPLSLAYRGVWANDQPQPSTLDVSAILGVRGLLGNSDVRFDAKRAGASASFTSLRSSFQMYESVLRWTASARLEGQLASGPLLPSEQFVAGGADSVRGYLEGERTGDNAVRLQLELQSAPYKLGAAWALRAAGFIDQAVLGTKQAGLGQKSRTVLAGAGLGLRVAGPRGAMLQLDAARALTDGDVTGGGTRANAWRLHGRVSVEF